MNKSSINDLAGKLADALPADMDNLRQDIESNFRALLTSGLNKLDLVTREEFEVQRKVLERTRAKLDRLEAELAGLETESGSTSAGAENPGDA